MLASAKPWLGLDFKCYLERRGDYSAFHQVVLMNGYRELLGAIEEGDAVVDAGANIGCFSLSASRLVGKGGIVVAVEPEPHNAEILRRNIRLNEANNVLVVEKALWSSPGVALRISDEGAGSSIGSGGSEVVATTLDEISREMGIRPEVLKMDIEGSEGAALSAAGGALENLRIAEIEVHDQLNMRMVAEALSGFRLEEKRADEIGRAVARALRHPLGALNLEVHNRFRTTSRVVRALLAGGTPGRFPLVVIARRRSGQKRPFMASNI
ncbi:MAG: FkbM family methyltransferase [Conexivisphaera sp.]